MKRTILSYVVVWALAIFGLGVEAQQQGKPTINDPISGEWEDTISF